MVRTVGAMLATLALGASVAAGQAHDHHAARADTLRVPLYETLGDHHYDISTRNPLAQQYFNQGLRWLYAFNHAAAIQAFSEAERLDPTCAMCPWGVALAYGPNINAGMDSVSGVLAYAAVERARRNAPTASTREQALVGALSKRYAAVPPANRAHLDSAYANAMRDVANRYREDLDAQVLHADALMNLSPWNYWTSEGEPRPGTTEVLGRLGYALEKNPNHPGACHLFIHAEEAHAPARAVPCAERLAALMPGAGHIVHMPGHIYIRVGRYADAIDVNRHAVHADESYLEGPHVNRHGIYPQGYYPHNYHFMSFAASMAGQRATAVFAARKVAEQVGPEVAREIAWLEAVTPVVYWTLVTFGQWDEVLAEPLPPNDLRFTTGMAYYARGVAFAAKHRWAEAQAALDTVTSVARDFLEGDNRNALLIAQHSLAGEIALRRGDAAASIRHFRVAAELEDGLTYNEPPTWYYPVRHSLGRALLAANRAADAERVYREDLERFPQNGWSLWGLSQSLEAQGKLDAAREVRAAFTEAWKHADVRLEASRF